MHLPSFFLLMRFANFGCALKGKLGPSCASEKRARFGGRIGKVKKKTICYRVLEFLLAGHCIFWRNGQNKRQRKGHKCRQGLVSHPATHENGKCFCYSGYVPTHRHHRAGARIECLIAGVRVLFRVQQQLFVLFSFFFSCRATPLESNLST